MQGITRTQAEEYVHKSEELLRDAGEFLKDAVKVVPPEEGGQVPAGMMWDGSDIWMLPEMASTPSDTNGKGKERRSGDSRASAEGLRAVATRAEALLKQLKHDPAVLSVNPEADERAKQMWDEWLSMEVNNMEAGLESELWKDAKEAALSDPVDGEALKNTMDTLGTLFITLLSYLLTAASQCHPSYLRRPSGSGTSSGCTRCLGRSRGEKLFCKVHFCALQIITHRLSLFV